MKKSFFLLSFLLLSLSLIAQVTISYPTSRAVFQRNNNNQSTIYVAGNYTSFSDKVEARAIARTMTPAQGVTTNWVTIQSNPVNGFYYGSLNVSGGWYDIEVRCWNGETLVGSSSVFRIGVGEIFLIAGQSNATGEYTERSQGNFGPMANDDRVSIVNLILPFNTTYGSISLPRPDFVHLDSTFNIAPFGISAWCWGALGDTLTKRLNVPVAFFNGAWASSGLTSWQESANDSTATASNFFTMPRGMPYGMLRSALNFYAAQFGVRAVLWHQGETDCLVETSRNTYGSYLKNVIQKSRLHSGKNDLAWVVSRATRFKGFNLTRSKVWQPVIDAQNDVIGLNGTNQSSYTSRVFEGPATDMLVGPNVRDNDSLHFKGQGHRILASAWNQKLTSSFFANSTPYLPLPPPALVSNSTGEGLITVNVVNSYPSIAWTSNSTADNMLSSLPSFLSTQGSYRVRVRDAVGNVLISPEINIPNNFTNFITITSKATGLWSDVNSWDLGRLPTATDNVIINTGNQITIGGGMARYKKLEIKGQLRFSNTGNLQN